MDEDWEYPYDLGNLHIADIAYFFLYVGSSEAGFMSQCDLQHRLTKEVLAHLHRDDKACGAPQVMFVGL